MRPGVFVHRLAKWNSFQTVMTNDHYLCHILHTPLAGLGKYSVKLLCTRSRNIILHAKFQENLIVKTCMLGLVIFILLVWNFVWHSTTLGYLPGGTCACVWVCICLHMKNSSLPTNYLLTGLCTCTLWLIWLTYQTITLETMKAKYLHATPIFYM